MSPFDAGLHSKHVHDPHGEVCDVSAARAKACGRPHVVIVGAGFGGLTAAKKLGRAPVNVTVIDRRNYHLFQPLLYQVATAGLSPADIATPIRGILRSQKNTTVLLDEVKGVDAKSQAVLLSGRRVPYDYLIVATGARHGYFGHDEWEPYAPGLKKLEDATGIRHRVLVAFERAELECDAEERERLLNFVIVGGGPTGVELAGAIAELSKRALASDFRNICPQCARITLIEAGPRILPAFPESLSEKARRSLEDLGVEVRTGKAVTACDGGGVRLGDEKFPARTILWAAGVVASPAAGWLGVAQDRAGRVVVEPNLSVGGLPNVFAIGDTASAKDAQGRPLPGVAPVAKQQGAYVAKLILDRMKGKESPPFRYQNMGNLATIGRKAAVADFGFMRLSGFIAWLLWAVAHVYFLIGFRNRIQVALDWTWAYVTFERGARLITGPAPPLAAREMAGPAPAATVAPRMTAGR
jgi:NADH dehydrogenase